MKAFAVGLLIAAGFTAVATAPIMVRSTYEATAARCIARGLPVTEATGYLKLCNATLNN
jgi:hypothetical protein